MNVTTTEWPLSRWWQIFLWLTFSLFSSLIIFALLCVKSLQKFLHLLSSIKISNKSFTLQLIITKYANSRKRKYWKSNKPDMKRGSRKESSNGTITWQWQNRTYFDCNGYGTVIWRWQNHTQWQNRKEKRN